MEFNISTFGFIWTRGYFITRYKFFICIGIGIGDDSGSDEANCGDIGCDAMGKADGGNNDNSLVFRCRHLQSQLFGFALSFLPHDPPFILTVLLFL